MHGIALQHYEIGHGELDHVEEGQDSLLENGRAKLACHQRRRPGYKVVGRCAALEGRAIVLVRGGQLSVLTGQEAVVLLDSAAQKLE